MPELPEVENVKQGLQKILGSNAILSHIVLNRKDLRFPFPLEKLLSVHNVKLLNIERKAKYILFEFKDFYLMSHLGMTGTWRVITTKKIANKVILTSTQNVNSFSGGDLSEPQLDDGYVIKQEVIVETEELGPHDHILLYFENCVLVYRDPRRFGVFDYLAKDQKAHHKLLFHLGPDPLDPSLTSESLAASAAKKKQALKVCLMDQKFLVGVGNIYASEALFYAGLSPFRTTTSVSKEQWKMLLQEIRHVLERSIKAGGTTISDYRQASGSGGTFQERLAVYERAGEPCYGCGEEIQCTTLIGRSTYYCLHCQK